MILFLLPVLALRCSLFEPREPEPPTESGLDFKPQTIASNVILNLQTAIVKKDVANYARCFADPASGSLEYTFTPTTAALARYSALASWGFAEEETYFQNLVAKAIPNGFTNLTFIARDSLVTTDSVTYNFDYTLIFEHTEADFPSTASGNLQFTVAQENSNWAITRWIDFSSSDVSWSSFKGRFSN